MPQFKKAWSLFLNFKELDKRCIYGEIHFVWVFSTNAHGQRLGHSQTLLVRFCADFHDWLKLCHLSTTVFASSISETEGLTLTVHPASVLFIILQMNCHIILHDSYFILFNFCRTQSVIIVEVCVSHREYVIN